MDERIKAHMALVDEFATTTAVVAVGRDRALNTQSQTEDAIEARNAVEAALRAPQQAEEILQSLGWTCIGGVWTEDRAATATLAPQQAEPVAAQHRFRHPQKGTPDWSVWQPCAVSNRPAWEIDSQGYEVEYRALCVLAATPSAPTAVEPDERAEFEAAYRARYPVSCDLDPAKFNRSDVGDYEDIRVSIAWAMWQARASKGKP